MQVHDPAGEFLRVAEHYRQMSDAEIQILARQRSELTDLAQQALAMEMSNRGLKPEPKEPPAPPVHEAPPHPSAPEDSDYKEERELVELCTVWSLRDALQVQRLLDVAGIPFYMGPEKATGVDQVTSSFPNGVSVRIMRVGIPWAGPAMRDYEPQDEPPRTHVEEGDAAPVRCPKCHSEEVIFEQLVNSEDDSSELSNGDSEPPNRNSVQSQNRFEWTCDSCGFHWQDDGLAKEE